MEYIPCIKYNGSSHYNTHYLINRESCEKIAGKMERIEGTEMKFVVTLLLCKARMAGLIDEKIMAISARLISHRIYRRQDDPSSRGCGGYKQNNNTSRDMLLQNIWIEANNRIGLL
jgi:hypothetical protein